MGDGNANTQIRVGRTTHRAGAGAGAEPYTIRSYEADDDGGCQALELAATQGSWAAEVAFTHHGPFQAKAAQFCSWAILVAESSDGAVVGVVCGVLKDVYLGCKPCTVGYVFDLRVHPEHGRRGLATALMDRLEDAMAGAGAAVLYLTVNKTNAGATQLYSRRGYWELSHRCLSFSPLFGAWVRRAVLGSRAHQIGGEGSAGIEVVDGAEFAGLYRAYLNETTDMALRRPEELTESLAFEEGYVLRDEATGSLALLGLYNGSSHTGVELKRLIVPSWVWGSRLFQASAAAVYLAGAGWIVRAAPVMVAVLLAVLQVVAGAFVVFVVRRVLGGAWRARLVAPVASGVRGEALLGQVVAFGKARAEAKGYAAAIFNVSQCDTLARVARAKRSATLFMAKRLTAGVSEGYVLSADAFFDPRDI